MHLREIDGWTLGYFTLSIEYRGGVAEGDGRREIAEREVDQYENRKINCFLLLT